MRYIFSGADKLREETRQLHAERLGARVLEGYGATETAPVLALNTPMHSKPDAAGAALLAHARACGAPEIAVPRVIRVVPALPRLAAEQARGSAPDPARGQGPLDT